MTFDQASRLRAWTPIRDCPGRFVLRGQPATLSLRELLGFALEVLRFPQSNAADCVLIVSLEDGGIISYERPDGSLLHTLNTQAGFSRKLDQLGIKLPGPTT
ncbi:MAG: hypothetical protein P4N60_24495 [Verrucomicrobiae bacterium]|nr:hypothetical protein [Verrucomicrobiae bacterium]